MNLGLNNRIAIVTGGSKGIGLSISSRLAEEGAKVIICARDGKQIQKVCTGIKKAGGYAYGVITDVTKPQSIETSIKKVIEKYKRIDILVNNAGGAGKFADFTDLSDEDWIDAYKFNVLSMVNFIKLTLPYIRKSKSPRIINISSISAISPGSFNPHYTVNKAAVLNLSKYLSNKYASEKILINTVCAGPIHSDSWDKNIERLAKIKNLSLKEARQMVEKEEGAKIRLGRVGNGEDVAGLVAFLASDQASFITGSCFRVDGGKLNTIF